MKYIFHPEALTEYACAVEFYAEQNKDLAQEFINSVESAIFKVIEFPLRWPIIEDPVRRCLTRKFPYFYVSFYHHVYLIGFAAPFFLNSGD